MLPEAEGASGMSTFNSVLLHMITNVQKGDFLQTLPVWSVPTLEQVRVFGWSHSVLTVQAGYSPRQSFWSWPSLAAWTYRWNRTEAEFGTDGFRSSWASLRHRVTYWLTHTHTHKHIYTRVYPKVSGLASWSENCKWYSSLPLGAVLSLFCESV